MTLFAKRDHVPWAPGISDNIEITGVDRREMVKVHDHSMQPQLGSIPTINMAGRWIRKYRLTLLFAITALAAITITTTLVLNRVASENAESSVIRSAEYLVSAPDLANDDPMLTCGACGKQGQTLKRSAVWDNKNNPTMSRFSRPSGPESS